MSRKRATSASLPFIIFKQSFVCVEDLDELLNGFALTFDDCIELVKEESWFEYWQREGNEVVLQLWKKKYSDYLIDTVAEDIDFEEKEKREKEVTEANTLDTTSTEEELSNVLTWEDLWEEHTSSVYTEQYKAFEEIYENYYWLLKKSISVEKKIKKNVEITNEQLKLELEAIKLAGLPTAFGNSIEKVKIKAQKQKIPTKIVLEQHKEELNESDSNRESDPNDSSSTENELEMPPIKIVAENSSLSTNDNNSLHEIERNAIKKTKKKQNRKLRQVPEFMQAEKSMLKYWRQRFTLFSRFDEGIQLDRESWFSVTPEKVAQHMAKRLACNVIVDGFCGSGGNTIQFAQTCEKVIAIDIDANKIEMARHNASIYGVADKIEFIVGDFLELSKNGLIAADAVFLSPPWGGPEYKSVEKYDIETFLDPVSATELMKCTRNISENIAFFLPRNSDMKQIIRLAGIGNGCEVETNYLGSRVVGLTAFYGGCIKNI